VGGGRTDDELVLGLVQRGTGYTAIAPDFLSVDNGAECASSIHDPESPSLVHDGQVVSGNHVGLFLGNGEIGVVEDVGFAVSGRTPHEKGKPCEEELSVVEDLFRLLSSSFQDPLAGGIASAARFSRVVFSASISLACRSLSKRLFMMGMSTAGLVERRVLKCSRLMTRA